MRELLDGLDRWFAGGHRVALARVVQVDGSGPRPPGAAMAVNENGEVLGSVSGGCVEAAVVEAAVAVLGGAPAHLRRFGYSDEDAFAVGLTCGGTIQVSIARLLPDEVHRVWGRAVRAGAPVALATVVEGPGAGSGMLVGAAADSEPDSEPGPRPGTRSLGIGTPGTGSPGTGSPGTGSLGNAELDRVVARDAAGELANGVTRLRRYGRRGEARRDDVVVLIQSFVPPARMLVFGAVDFADSLTRVARVLGFRTILCDARAVFATRARFPAADEVVVDWPHRLLGRIGPGLTARDVVCVLTHEARFDVPAIQAALGTGAGFVGAMGSRRTHADRMRRLREAEVDEAALARLRSPIGLDLGARTPEETAVSICAEVIAVRSGAVPALPPLSATAGPIHHRAPLESVAGL